MKYSSKLDHHSEDYNPNEYNGMDANDLAFEKALNTIDRELCTFNMYCPKL